MATTTRSRAPKARPARGTRPTSGGFRPTVRRSKPQPTGIDALMAKVPGLLGGGAAAKKTASGAKSKPVQMAALAGAAGLAFKNRDKLMGLLGRKGDAHEEAPRAAPVDPPYAPTAAQATTTGGAEHRSG